MQVSQTARAAQRFTLERLAGNDQLVLGVLAILCGAITGYAALGFLFAVDVLTGLLWGVPEEDMPAAAAATAWPWVVAIPTLGGLILGIAYRHLLTAPPQGVSNVMEAVALRGGRMSFKNGFSVASVSIFSIAIGGSVGREGPIVHLGASLVSGIASKLNLAVVHVRTIVGCGVAAGVAAAFNAPLAGAFFALEVVIGHYRLGAFSPVVMASLVGTMVSRIHYGDEQAFSLPPLDIVTFWEIPAFILLGATASLGAIAIIHSIQLVQDTHARVGIRPWLRPFIGGAILGGIALLVPEVLGIGYKLTTTAFANDGDLLLILALLGAKCAATVVCLGSRFGGGIFSPSLAIGALLGAAFGICATALFPEGSSDVRVYVVIGMGAVAASTLGAPISTVIMVFELTGDYAVTFGLLPAAAIATLITRQTYGMSFFTWQLWRRGVVLDRAAEMALLSQRKVADLLRAGHISVDTDDGIEVIKRRFCESPGPIFVLGENRELQGAIDVVDFAEAASTADTDGEKTARDLAKPAPLVVAAEDDLSDVWNQMRSLELDHIPVTRSRHDPELVGSLKAADVVRAYNSALMAAREAEMGR